MLVRLRNLSIQRLSWPESKTAICKHNFSVKVAKNRPFLYVKLNLLKGKTDFKTENHCVCTCPIVTLCAHCIFSHKYSMKYQSIFSHLIFTLCTCVLYNVYVKILYGTSVALIPNTTGVESANTNVIGQRSPVARD